MINLDGVELQGTIENRKCEYCDKTETIYCIRDHVYNLSQCLCRKCLLRLHDIDDKALELLMK